MRCIINKITQMDLDCSTPQQLNLTVPLVCLHPDSCCWNVSFMIRAGAGTLQQWSIWMLGQGYSTATLPADRSIFNTFKIQQWWWSSLYYGHTHQAVVDNCTSASRSVNTESIGIRCAPFTALCMLTMGWRLVVLKSVKKLFALPRDQTVISKVPLGHLLT